MRRFLWWVGFPTAAVFAALIAPWNDAQADELPAKCENGVCTMSEADFKKLREFHKAERKRIEKMFDEMATEYQAWAHLAQKLKSCQAILEERKV